MKEFIKKFEVLLESGKIEDAKRALEEWAKAPATPEEEGFAKILLTRLYIKLDNAANEAYYRVLQDALADLRELDAREKQFLEAGKLAKARADLNG